MRDLLAVPQGPAHGHHRRHAGGANRPGYALFQPDKHERYDGQGYPGKLQGEAIPLEARIIAVADTYDAITNDRPYRKPLEENAAIEEMKRSAGTQIDPKIVSALVDMLTKENDQSDLPG